MPNFLARFKKLLQRIKHNTAHEFPTYRTQSVFTSTLVNVCLNVERSQKKLCTAFFVLLFISRQCRYIKTPYRGR